MKAENRPLLVIAQLAKIGYAETFILGVCIISLFNYQKPHLFHLLHLLVLYCSFAYRFSEVYRALRLGFTPGTMRHRAYTVSLPTTAPSIGFKKGCKHLTHLNFISAGLTKSVVLVSCCKSYGFWIGLIGDVT